MIDLIKSLVAPILKPLIDRIPDPNERARAREEAESQMISGLMAIVQGQLKVNMKEAEHSSIFVAGWRPFIGWVCGVGVAWNYVIQPLVMWGAFLYGVDLKNPPQLDISDLLVLLGGMLGLGGLRTYEKSVGVARETSPFGKKVQ